MIIGLTGLAGSGKDTVAALLAMKGFQRYAFADGVREEVAESIRNVQQVLGERNPWSRCMDVLCDLKITKAILDGEITPEMVWGKPTSPLMRVLLQKHGTEFRRAQDPEYWVNKLMTQLVWDRARYITKYKEDMVRLNTCRPMEHELVAISDVRFPNEVEAIRERGGRIWRVKRDSIGSGDVHISESGQSEIVADVEIDNNGTVYDLALKVRDLL